MGAGPPLSKGISSTQAVKTHEVLAPGNKASFLTMKQLPVPFPSSLWLLGSSESDWQHRPPAPCP